MPRLKTRKGFWLLALLALRHGRDVPRDWLAGTLWPNAEESLSLTYLRQALTDLRHALGSEATRLQSPTTRVLRLDLTGADVDVLTFDTTIRKGDAASLETAVSVYRSVLLEGCTEEWVLQERTSRQQAYLGALEVLARLAQEARDFATAVRRVRLIIAAEPLRESAYRTLMQSLAGMRDYAAITEAYRELRLLLRQEVNADPEAETQALFERLRSQARQSAAVSSVNQPSAAAFLKPPGRSTFLPRPLTDFIGREPEIQEAKQCLSVTRLLTLTGIGGVGKTRMAIRLGEELTADFPDGIYFVDLAPLSNPVLVPQATANALKISERTGETPLTAMVEFLRSRHLLLILDNCEHLLDACAELTGTLLWECPQLRILATGRQRLGINGEIERRVPPLRLPDLESSSLNKKETFPVLLESEAVRLFVERARRVAPNLYLDDTSAQSIAHICYRLDGIPLALELAAARLSALGLDQLSARLEDRFRLLVRGGRDAQPRQQTLRGLLDWSWDLLTEEERILLRRLAVFAGGWTLEAAETICANDTEDVLDGLTLLTDRSLVVAEPQKSGSLRYRLLETVRQYAQEKLDESGETANLQARHQEYFANLAQEASQRISSPEQAQWLERLEQEHDNLRTALDWRLDMVEGLQASMFLAGHLQRFWILRAHIGEGRRRYESLLARSVENEETLLEARAVALRGAGRLAHRQADYPSARTYLEQALVLYERLNNQTAMAPVLLPLGHVECVSGNHDLAQTLYEQSLKLHRESGERYGEAASLDGLGNVARLRGYLAAARGLFSQALTISQEIGDYDLQAMHLNSLGLIANQQGEDAVSWSFFEQARELHRQIGNRTQETISLNNLANIARKMDDMTTAIQLYREGLALCRELGENRSQRIIVYLLEGLPVPLFRQGQYIRAARLFGAGANLRETLKMPRPAHEWETYSPLVEELKMLMGEEVYHQEHAIGKSLSPQQAINYALEDT